MPVSNDAAAVLRGLRRAFSVIQSSKKELYTRTVYGLGILFLGAVLAIELHIEFGFSILWYLVLFAAILGLYLWAKLGFLQQIVEDYRAVSEALRVQLAWWATGMVGREHDVANYFLAGTTGSLGLVRAAIRSAIASARLEYDAPTVVQAATAGWVKEQIEFFDKNVQKRELRLSWLEDAIWFFFIASAGMALVLLHQVEQLVAPAGGGSPVGVAIVLVGLAILSRGFSVSGRLASRRSLRMALIGVGNAIALLWGILVGVLVVQIAPNHDFAHKLTVLAVIMTASLAGVIRFFIDRLGWEAELHSYREALEAFRRARDRLASLDAAASREARERIIFQLGKFALAENKSWIRAHRLRPIEPMH